MHDPRAEIAHVDELHGCIRRRGRKHSSSLGDPARPVREAVGRIVRADDEPGTDDQPAVTVRIRDDPLAHRLERAVVLDALARRIIELRYRRALDRRRALVGIHGDARDVDVAPDAVPQRVGRQRDDAREERGNVDRGVPHSVSERAEILGAPAY